MLQVAGVHAGTERGITLQLHRLTVVGRRYAHANNEHVRKTLDPGLSHSAAIRRVCRTALAGSEWQRGAGNIGNKRFPLTKMQIIDG